MAVLREVSSSNQRA